MGHDHVNGAPRQMARTPRPKRVRKPKQQFEAGPARRDKGGDYVSSPEPSSNKRAKRGFLYYTNPSRFRERPQRAEWDLEGSKIGFYDPENPGIGSGPSS